MDNNHPLLKFSVLRRVQLRLDFCAVSRFVDLVRWQPTVEITVIVKRKRRLLAGITSSRLQNTRESRTTLLDFFSYATY